MNICLIIGALVLMSASVVSAYFTGKAELTFRQMMRQPEVYGFWWLSYGCYMWLYIRTAPSTEDVSATIMGAIAMGFTVLCLWALPVMAHDMGLKRKQAER